MSILDAAAGVSALLIGAAYVTMAFITTGELLRDRRARGWSTFGAAFAVMAATCGPHHLAHGAHVLLEGRHSPLAVTVTTFAGLPGALTFLYLRIERGLGGRGDRTWAGPLWLVFLPAPLLTFGFGGMLGAALARDGLSQLTAAGLPSLILTINYGIVGALMLATQRRRRLASGQWSASGMGLASFFPTCAATHAAMAITGACDTHVAVIDVIGVPASFLFLWAVRELHREGLRDWNRRPLAGRPAPAARPAPWSPELRADLAAASGR